MISILIPVFNTPINYIQECFHSIEQQTYKNYEIVVINDGSEALVSDFLHNYKTNNSYTIIDQDRKGISSALNLGIKHCKFDMIARMDADDIMLPDRLEKQIIYFDTHEVDILGGQMVFFGDMNFVTNHPYIVPKDIMRYTGWFMNHPTIIYKKQKILNLKGYNLEYDGCEDLELWCRALANGMILRNLSDVILKHRRHNNNATVTQNHNQIQNKVLKIRSFYYNKICGTLC